MCVWGFLQVSAVSTQVKRESINPLELELQVLVNLPLWLLGAKLLKELYFLLTVNQCLQPQGETLRSFRQCVDLQ